MVFDVLTVLVGVAMLLGLLWLLVASVVTEFAHDEALAAEAALNEQRIDNGWRTVAADRKQR